jgi:hypothetical protein
VGSFGTQETRTSAFLQQRGWPFLAQQHVHNRQSVLVAGASKVTVLLLLKASKDPEGEEFLAAYEKGTHTFFPLHSHAFLRL